MHSLIIATACTALGLGIVAFCAWLARRKPEMEEASGTRRCWDCQHCYRYGCMGSATRCTLHNRKIPVRRYACAKFIPHINHNTTPQTTMTPTHRKFRAGDIVCFKHLYIELPLCAIQHPEIFWLNPELKFRLDEDEDKDGLVRLPDAIRRLQTYAQVPRYNLRLIEPAEPGKAEREREAKLERIQASIRDLQRQVDELKD